MKIPNYDKQKKLQKNLIISLMKIFASLSQENLVAEKQILSYIFSENLWFTLIKFIFIPQIFIRKKIQDLQELMGGISEKVGYPVLEVDGPEDIKNTTDYPSDNRKIVVFDDVINAPEKIQKKIANHWTDGRQHGISPIYLSQSYYDTPQKLRLNCSNMILYPPTTQNHKNLIAKENSLDTRYFDQLKPFDF